MGGVWVAMSVPLVFKLGPWPVLLISVGATVLFCVVWFIFLRRPKAGNVVQYAASKKD